MKVAYPFLLVPALFFGNALVNADTPKLPTCSTGKIQTGQTVSCTYGSEGTLSGCAIRLEDGTDERVTSGIAANDEGVLYSESTCRGCSYIHTGVLLVDQDNKFFSGKKPTLIGKDHQPVMACKYSAVILSDTKKLATRLTGCSNEEGLEFLLDNPDHADAPKNRLYDAETQIYNTKPNERDNDQNGFMLCLPCPEIPLSDTYANTIVTHPDLGSKNSLKSDYRSLSPEVEEINTLGLYIAKQTMIPIQGRLKPCAALASTPKSLVMKDPARGVEASSVCTGSFKYSRDQKSCSGDFSCDQFKVSVRGSAIPLQQTSINALKSAIFGIQCSGGNTEQCEQKTLQACYDENPTSPPKAIEADDNVRKAVQAK